VQQLSAPLPPGPQLVIPGPPGAQLGGVPASTSASGTPPIASVPASTTGTPDGTPLVPAGTPLADPEPTGALPLLEVVAVDRPPQPTTSSATHPAAQSAPRAGQLRAAERRASGVGAAAAGGHDDIERDRATEHLRCFQGPGGGPPDHLQVVAGASSRCSHFGECQLRLGPDPICGVGNENNSEYLRTSATPASVTPDARTSDEADRGRIGRLARPRKSTTAPARMTSAPVFEDNRTGTHDKCTCLRGHPHRHA
jgi:hypothetical protein